MEIKTKQPTWKLSTILKFPRCADCFKTICRRIRSEMKIFYYRTLPHVGWGFQSVRNFPIEIKTIQRNSKISTNLKFPLCPTGNKTICRRIRQKMTILLLTLTLDIYIIMWAVGLSFFLSVRLLLAYGNQNQTTHVKSKHNSEIPTMCRTF